VAGGTGGGDNDPRTKSIHGRKVVIQFKHSVSYFHPIEYLKETVLFNLLLEMAMKIVMDSDVLIKLAKIGFKETVVTHLEIFIPKKVLEETAMESRDYPDARAIRENISEGKIHVSESFRNEKGEIEALNLYRSGGFELIASDDRRFLNHIEKNNIPYLTSSSLIIYLFYKKKLSKKDTIKYIDSLKVHISKDQYLTAISEVQRWEK
jgi:hypothetical protein